MEVVYDIKTITNNISTARDILQHNVVLMFKDFYEGLAKHLSQELIQGCWSLNLANSNCYSLGRASKNHKGSVVITENEAIYLNEMYGIKDIYVPINCGDCREGLQVEDAVNLAKNISKCSWLNVYGLITSGCMNSIAPTVRELTSIWERLSDRSSVKGISLGGSYWIGREVLPDFVLDIRIGEYMLFGTIPYCDDKSKENANGVTLEANVIAVYPKRQQLIIDCGYKYADIKKCKLLSTDLHYYDSSSEYSIFDYGKTKYVEGDKIYFVPNYKSLVTLKDANTSYRE